MESRGILFELVTGGFGTLVMIVMGFGGFASVYFTRQGQSSKQTPILGVMMLLVAISVFAMRVMIRAGLFGHEYIEW